MRWGGLGEERRRFPPEPIWRSAAAAAGRARLRGARGPLALRPGPDQARARLAPRVADMIRIACLHVPDADATVQSALLDIALRHSPSVEDVAPGIVFLDFRGLGRLWGGEEEPARGLGRRRGGGAPRLQRLRRGEDPRQPRLWTPPPVFEESAECAWGVEALEPLGDLMAGLAEALCARLRRDELTADAFAWTCRLADRTEHEGFCAPAAPLADPAAAAALLRASLAARPPHAAVEGITLRAHPLRAPKAQPRFDEPPGPSPRLLTAALARLSGLIGASGIGAPELLDSHRPDAMQMTPFVLFPLQGERARGLRRENGIPLPHRGRGPQFELSRKSGEASAEINQVAVLAVRRMRPPRPAQVTLAAGVPTHLRAIGLAGRIVTGAGPWRVSGEWWTDDAFVQDEWDVELGDGTLCRLARDGRGWRLEAIYD